MIKTLNRQLRQLQRQIHVNISKTIPTYIGFVVRSRKKCTYYFGKNVCSELERIIFFTCFLFTRYYNVSANFYFFVFKTHKAINYCTCF